MAGLTVTKPIYVSNFKSVLPRFALAQEDTFDWLEAAHLRSEQTRVLLNAAGAQNGEQSKAPTHTQDRSGETVSVDALQRMLSTGLRRFGCSPARLRFRYTELEDFTHTRWENMQVFRLHERSSGADLGARMAVYQEAADQALRALYPVESDAAGRVNSVEGNIRVGQPPALMIHVSCTGYLSPCPTQRLISLRGWNECTESHQAYHMGCYAAVPALRTALLAAEAGRYNRVDVVHTELCTLHFDPSVHDAEQLVVQSLFADGHIAYEVSAQRPASGTGFRILSVLEQLIPDALDHMTWTPGSHNLTMRLARDVPQLVAGHVGDFVERLCGRAGVDVRSVLGSGLAALHPGGPRIIDGLQDVLDLTDDQVSASRRVLLDRGNMSSATLPHILQRMLSDSSSASDELVLGLAFGPGLTMAGLLLERC
jgi:predicted naringenin-chalcone synthase